ncbi:MAG: hypothetical protein KAH57_08695 [Thermoplasmata archaeon]|nr:hypothetical protein [Thermoplasmata archaeon]
MLPDTPEEMGQALLDWLQDLNEMEENVVILVEGKKDTACLEKIGVTAPIVQINQGIPLLEVISSISRDDRYQRAVILTDWDRKGGQLAAELKRLCTSDGLPYDTYIRKRIAMLTGKWVRDVESLGSVFDRFVQ